MDPQISTHLILSQMRLYELEHTEKRLEVSLWPPDFTQALYIQEKEIRDETQQNMTSVYGALLFWHGEDLL